MKLFLHINIITLLCGLTNGVGFRVKDGPLVPSYSCPPSSGISRNDTVGEFFTLSRQFDGPLNLIRIEVPTNLVEFNCGFVNRNVTEGGFLFPWNDAGTRSFYFRSIPFNSELVLMDKFKTITGIQNSTAFSLPVFNAPPTLQYALLVQAGIANRLGLSIGDPLQVTLPSNTFFGTGQTAGDDHIAMHT